MAMTKQTRINKILLKVLSMLFSITSITIALTYQDIVLALIYLLIALLLLLVSFSIGRRAVSKGSYPANIAPQAIEPEHVYFVLMGNGDKFELLNLDELRTKRPSLEKAFVIKIIKAGTYEEALSMYTNYVNNHSW